jgi:pimeloyl-ACP methyl ester carboxylesterase
VALEDAAGGDDLRRPPPAQPLDSHGPAQRDTAPTLIIAGRDDFIFPPEHQRELAAAIPHAHLQIIKRAGHNPHAEQPAQVMQAIRDFISA